MQKKYGAVAIAALAVGHVVGMIDLVALPVWVGALVERYGFQPQQAGALLTLFLLGAVLASTLISRWFDRLNQRVVAVAGFAAAGIAFYLASLQTGFGQLAALHGLAGLSVGCALSMVHGTLGRTADPHRNYAIANIALGFFALVFLGGVPQLMIGFGAPVLFQIFAAVMGIAALVSLRWFVNPAPVRSEARGGRMSGAVWLTILGVCLMTFNQSMVFSFVEVIGGARGFSREAVLGTLLGLGIVNFIIAGPAAAILEHRLPAFAVVRAGPVVQAIFAVIVTSVAIFPVWAVVAAFFVAVQIFTHTFAFGLLAKMDQTGKSVAATPAMLMIGAALGPIVGGALGQNFGYGALGVAAVIVAGLSFLAFSRAQAGAPQLAYV